MAEYSNPVQNPNAKMTLAEMLKAAGDGIAIESRSDKEQKNQEKNVVSGLGNYNFPKRDEMPKALTEQKIKLALAQIPKSVMTPVAPVKMVPADPNFGRKGVGLVTNNITYGSVKADTGMLSILKQKLFEKNDILLPEKQKEWNAELEKATHYIVTNGPSSGLYVRIVQGAISTRKEVKLEKKLLVKMFLKSFGVDKTNFVQMAEQGPDSFIESVEVNINANSGYPRQQMKQSIIVPMYADAIEVWNAIAQGRLSKDMQERPEYYLVQLKNKMDRYKRDEVAKKIRPYYVYPGHLALLYSMVIQNLASTFQTFDKKSSSNLAIGFSWNYGGGQRLYDWINTRTELFNWISFSDDALWVIVLPNGEKWILCPDVVHMDMSLQNSIGTQFYEAVTGVFGTEMGPTWQGVFRLNCVTAFQTTVNMGHALCYFLREMLHTGVPGTSYFDQFASMLVAEVVVPKVLKYLKANDRAGFKENVQKQLKEDMGLEFKPATMKMYQFKPGRPSYDFTFLGQTLTQVKGGKEMEYVPKTPLESVFRGLVLPRRTYDTPTQRVSAYMERYRGVIASGGMHYPELYEAVKFYYNSFRTGGYEPRSELVEVDGTIELPFADLEFPSLAWIFNLYLSPDNKISHSNPLSSSPTESSGFEDLLNEVLSTIEDPIKVGKEQKKIPSRKPIIRDEKSAPKSVETKNKLMESKPKADEWKLKKKVPPPLPPKTRKPEEKSAGLKAKVGKEVEQAKNSSNWSDAAEIPDAVFPTLGYNLENFDIPQPMEVSSGMGGRKQPLTAGERAMLPKREKNASLKIPKLSKADKIKQARSIKENLKSLEAEDDSFEEEAELWEDPPELPPSSSDSDDDIDSRKHYIKSKYNEEEEVYADEDDFASDSSYEDDIY